MKELLNSLIAAVPGNPGNPGPAPGNPGAPGAPGSGDIFGQVKPPPGVEKYSPGATGLSVFINNIIKILIVGAAVYSVINLVIAGYDFMSAGDDPKKVAGAWAKIWQTVLGVAVAAGAFVLAAIFGQLIFGDPNFFLQLKIFGPGP